jgi:mannose-6-phosphate isomerase
MAELLFLSGPLKERIWGSKAFKEVFHLTDSEALLGEMWTASGLASSPSLIQGGKLNGLGLDKAYALYPHLFGSQAEEFPILVKILSTSADLSVQVHPDDEFALKCGLPCGKSEGWLILEAEKDAEIVIGTNAHDEKELRSYVAKKDYQGLLKRIKVHPGQFFPIPAGTVHALGKGLLVEEIQQSADVTFRFYDYDRVDKDGNKRPLHTELAIQATKFAPYAFSPADFFASKETIQTLWENKYFKARLVRVLNEFTFHEEPFFQIVTLAQGEGEAEGRKISRGSSFVIPAHSQAKIKGRCWLTIAEPVK